MSTAQIRETLHKYINETDSRFINLVYGMMKADENCRVGDEELTEAHKKILDKRLAKHFANPDAGAASG